MGGCKFAMINIRKSCKRNRTMERVKAMGRGIGLWIAIGALAGLLAFGWGAGAQTAAAPGESAAPTADDAVMLTIFLKHDE